MKIARDVTEYSVDFNRKSTWNYICVIRMLRFDSSTLAKLKHWLACHISSLGLNNFCLTYLSITFSPLKLHFIHTVGWVIVRSIEFCFVYDAHNRNIYNIPFDRQVWVLINLKHFQFAFSSFSILRYSMICAKRKRIFYAILRYGHS